MTIREDRFRSLPVRGRLAVVVKHLRSLLGTVQAMHAGVAAVPASLWSTVEIAQCACVDRLDSEEMETVEHLIHQLVSFDPKSHRLRWPDEADSLTAATTVAVQGAVDTGVHLLLAVKALQTRTVETAERELDEGFLTLVDAIDDFAAARGLARSVGLRGNVSPMPLARLDQDIQSLDELAVAADLDDYDYLSADDLTSGSRGEQLNDRAEPAVSNDRAPGSRQSGSRSLRGTDSNGRNAGLGILFMFLASAVVSVARHIPQLFQGDKPRRVAEQQLPRWEELQRQMPPGLERLGDLQVTMEVHGALQEAEQANKAGDLEGVDTALDKACSELERVSGIDTLSDPSAEILVRLAWRCGDLLKTRDPEQALVAYNKGCQLARALLDRRGTAEDRSCLAALLNNKSNALSDLGRHEETLQLLSQAVELQAAALEAEPDNDTYRTFLRHHLANQTSSLLAVKRWQEAAAAVQRWCEVSNKNEQELYESVCRLAHVATTIRDAAEVGELRSELVRQLVFQATELLRELRGPDVRIEDEIQQNASLEILGTPVPDSPHGGA